MSTKHAVPPSPSAPGATLWTNAITYMKNVAGRLVVPVASTDEMSEVWKLYRLTSSSDSVRPAVIRELAAGSGR